MTAPPSATGNLPLPRWAYVPGEADEADADYETLAQITALVPSRFGGYVPARHPALRYGIRLNDHGYFWESQEILEAVWAAAPQGGRERILHPDRDREFAPAHAKAARRGQAAGRRARRTQCTGRPQSRR
jgi:hypothetical protein